MSEGQENPWRNPHYARALGLVIGFRDRPEKPTAPVLKEFMSRLGHAPDMQISKLPEADVLLISRMIEGYVDARGIAR